jgi:hypothetical protein
LLGWGKHRGAWCVRGPWGGVGWGGVGWGGVGWGGVGSTAGDRRGEGVCADAAAYSGARGEACAPWPGA